MKTAKKILSVVTATVILAGSTACTSRTAADSQVSGSDVPSDSVSSDASAASDQSDPSLDMDGYEFESVYGSQLINYLEHQYYFNGEPVPIAESNYYFVDAFLDLTTYASYGYYPTTVEGYFDLSYDISDSNDSGYQTYGDFFVEYAEKMLESTLIINELAAEEGITLSQDRIDAVEQTIETLRTNQAEPAGKTLDEYLQIYYGPSCNEEAFRQVITNFYLADQYTENLIENYDYDEDEIMIPNIAYALYWAPAGETDEETLASQEALANEMLTTTCNYDIDLFQVEGPLAQTNGNVAEYGEIAVNRGQTVAAFEAWAYDESRQEGEMDVIYAEEYGYFVVGYLGKVEVDDDRKEQIAVSALGSMVTDIIEAGTYSFYTEDAFETPAQATMTSVLELDVSVPEATESLENATGLTGNATLDIVVVVLASIGCVAVIGVIAFAVKMISDKNKKEIVTKAESHTEEDLFDSKEDGEKKEE